MSELTLKRSIMLDSGEIIPAGSVLKNYGDFTPKSISPSLSTSARCKNSAKICEFLRMRNHPSHTYHKFAAIRK